MSNINWQYFPKSNQIPTHLRDVVDVFETLNDSITSDSFELVSDEVLGAVRESLEGIGYQVERGKKKVDKINIPVLFGLNGKLEKYFDADAYNEELQTVIEVEAGRAVTNYQFLKDLFQAIVMHGVNYLVVTVRKNYKNRKDFEYVVTFMETLYASQRIELPLNGILIIGY